jgi:hypothetical protein
MARIALGAIGDHEAVVAGFIDDLKSDNEKTRIAACNGLVELQRFAKDAEPALRAMIEKDPANGVFYAGAIYEITRKHVGSMTWGFNNIPGGYPW